MKNSDLAFSPELIAKVISDPITRVAVARESHLWFLALYLPHHIFFEVADFQKEIFALTQDKSNELAVIAAFRGSGKTTIIAQSFPIWAITGMLEKKYVLIISKTADQAKGIFKNIKSELENNELLKADLGPFYEESEEWKSYSLVLTKYSARITAVSSEQSIRGTKHGAKRPDLIILDDIEDVNSVKTKESRDNTYRWYKGDIVPLGDQGTQIYVIGNLLHRDSFIMRCKNDITEGRMTGVYREYPLISERGEIMWPGKYPNMEVIESLRKKVGDDVRFERGYNLKPLDEESAIIKPGWIHYYDKKQKLPDNFRYAITGVDPAITKKEAADYTAIITAKVYGYKENLRIYILPNPFNYQDEFPETVNILKQVRQEYKSRILVESNGSQKAFAQQLNHESVPAEEVGNYGSDKAVRLRMISGLIKDGRILFPRDDPTIELLINQMIFLGIESHDDLVDALTIIVRKVIDEDKEPSIPEIFWI
jgi:predicted phage terminase large subunit-like protein